MGFGIAFEFPLKTLAVAALRHVVLPDRHLCGIPVVETVRGRQDVVPVYQGSPAEKLVALLQNDSKGEALKTRGQWPCRRAGWRGNEL